MKIIINNSPTNNEYQSLHQTGISNTSVTVNNEVPPLSASVVGQRSETIPLLSTVSRVRRFVLRLRGHLDDGETGVIHNGGGGRYGGDGHPGGGDDRGPPSHPQPYHQQRDLDLMFLDQQYGNHHYDEHTLINSPEARRALREINDIYNGYGFDFEHPPEIWNDLHMDGNDNEIVVVEPDVIAGLEVAEPDTTRHRVIASIDQYDITSDGGNEASSNIGSRVSDGSDSPLFSDPVDESTSPSGLYTLDPYQANPQEQQLVATIRGGSGNEFMEDENQDINIQAAAAENQGSALLSHIEDEVPDRPTPPATDNPSSPSERTKRRRTGVFGCMSSTLASPVTSAARAARSIARHSGSAARSAASAT